MVEGMKNGAIIVDLASESGGNCELTQHTQEVTHGSVSIIGPNDLAAGTPIHASMMYSRNIEALVQHIVKDGALQLDREDEIVRDCLVTHDGRSCTRASPAAEGALTTMEAILLSIYIFVLAIFVGFEVITKVPQMLHTPLMSGRTPSPASPSSAPSSSPAVVSPRSASCSPSSPSPSPRRTSSAASWSRTGCSRCSAASRRMHDHRATGGLPIIIRSPTW
jgi:hypothetical protein